MIEIIRCDGSREKIEGPVRLKTGQDIVGGYVEPVHCLFGSVLLVNEEGRLKGLSVNLIASGIAGQTILGNVVHFSSKDEYEKNF